MIQYLISFIVYTLAMIGVLIIGFVVYKKAMLNNPIQKNSSLKIVDILKLPDRKILYVINCKNEEFLIGSTNENLTLISKLDNSKEKKRLEIEKYLQEKEETNNPYKDNFEPKNKVIKSLLKELSDKNQDKRGNY